MEQSMKVQIVPMNGDHLDEVAALERACFPDPWSRNMLAEELESTLTACRRELVPVVDGGGRAAALGGFGPDLDFLAEPGKPALHIGLLPDGSNPCHALRLPTLCGGGQSGLNQKAKENEHDPSRH